MENGKNILPGDSNRVATTFNVVVFPEHMEKVLKVVEAYAGAKMERINENSVAGVFAVTLFPKTENITLLCDAVSRAIDKSGGISFYAEPESVAV